MRIAYLVPEFPSQTHAFFWREASALRELGVDLHLCSTRRPRHLARHAFAAAAASETHYAFPPRLGRLPRQLGRPRGLGLCLRYLAGLRESGLARRLRQLALAAAATDLAEECLRRGVQHLHVHSCADAAHVGAMVHLLSGIPYSLTLHGDPEVYGGDHESKCRDASFVAVVTRDLQTKLRTALGSASPPLVRMGVDVERFTPPPHRTRRSSTPGRLRLLSVARLDHCKGHRYALEALRRIRDAGIDAVHTLVGDGRDRAEIEAFAERFGVREHLRFAGSLSEEEVLAELRQADVFVLASVGQGEAAPVSVMEAMATGLSVICSRIGGTAELIDDGQDGILVRQGDVETIAETACRLARSESMRQRLGEAARRKAVAEFSHRRWAGVLLAEIDRHACDARPDAEKLSSRAV